MNTPEEKSTVKKTRRHPILFYTNLKFLVAFIFLVCFAIGNFFVMNQQIRHTERVVTIISFLEGQRNRIQKATFFATAYAQSIDVEERKILRIDAHEELSSLLVFGTTSNDIISKKTQLALELIPTLRELYFSSSARLNREAGEYISSLKKFLMGSPIRVRPDNAQLLAFHKENERFLNSLTSTIEKFQKINTAKITSIKHLDQALFFLNLLFLGLIGLWVFLPTLRRLSVYLHQLSNVNEALEGKVAERTEELGKKTRQLVLSNEELREQIDERVRAERDLRQANAFLDSVIENIPNMLIIKDASDFRFVRFNRAGEELLGYHRDELLGKDDFSLFPKDQADFFIAKDKEALSSQTLLEIQEETIRTQKKGDRILHTKKIPVLDSQGRPAYLLRISEDITEKIQTEWQLREFAVAMENALDGIARLDPNRKFASVNKAFAAMMGYPPGELIGMNHVFVICPEDDDKMTAAFEKMKKEGKAELEIKAFRKDGSIFHQYVVLVRNMSKDQVFEGFYCFARDVTEYKYQESLEIKADLIQMVSHELRTPIHSVKEGLSIVLEGLTGEITPEQREVLSISKRCVDRLARLVTDVLAFHKLEAGVIEFHMEKENLTRIIEEVTASMRPLVENKSLSLKLELQKDLPEIELDRDKIVQVLTNFLQNAIKFTLHGRITIASSADSENVRISVKDTGIGIQQKDVPKLFRKFGQLESAKLVAPGGTGLGLAISKMLIERHHGKIEIESEYKRGSAFSFTLPLKQPPPLQVKNS